MIGHLIKLIKWLIIRWNWSSVALPFSLSLLCPTKATSRTSICWLQSKEMTGMNPTVKRTPSLFKRIGSRIILISMHIYYLENAFRITWISIFCVGECVLSLKQLLDNTSENFVSVLTHLGDESGEIQWVLLNHWKRNRDFEKK